MVESVYKAQKAAGANSISTKCSKRLPFHLIYIPIQAIPLQERTIFQLNYKISARDFRNGHGFDESVCWPTWAYRGSNRKVSLFSRYDTAFSRRRIQFYKRRDEAIHYKNAPISTKNCSRVVIERGRFRLKVDAVKSGSRQEVRRRPGHEKRTCAGGDRVFYSVEWNWETEIAKSMNSLFDDSKYLPNSIYEERWYGC